MSSESRKPLDQSRDKLARYFSQTAEGYASYLHGEYDQNYRDRKTFWDKHYGLMRDSFAQCVLRGIEDRNLPPHAEMNIAVVGPGTTPVGRDFDHQRLRDYVKDARSLVVIDFSATVVRDAVTNLFREGEVPREIIHPMQYDVTNGLSTVYETFINEGLSQVDTEEKLSRVTEEVFGKFDIANLRGRLLSELKRRKGVLHARPLEDLFEGGVNENRTLALSTGGEPLPLHMMYLPMVLAGTGAAAEGRFWEEYHTQTNNTDNLRGVAPTDAMQAEREKMVKRVHHMITHYNTEISYQLLHQIFHDNPDITVLAATDVNTVHKHPDFGEGARLDTQQLEHRLHAEDIKMRPRGEGVWEDEPEHYHRVRAFVFRKQPRGNTGGEQTEVPQVA